MKLLTKNSDYAVQSLVYLAKSNKDFLSSKEISHKNKIPYHYLRKIFQKLIAAGYVESKEGGKGGFRLKINPAKIRLVDVMKIFQGKVQLVDCMFQKKICHNRKTCILREHIKEAEEAVIEKLSKVTIKNLIRRKK
ncbi:MAG: Rrf2 family transcriptional regulator [Candidatus Aceula meridiana]|nr:Rrf2 family transcriptional regulator [Candidatus Aceula meridiana]